MCGLFIIVLSSFFILISKKQEPQTKRKHNLKLEVDRLNQSLGGSRPMGFPRLPGSWRPWKKRVATSWYVVISKPPLGTTVEFYHTPLEIRTFGILTPARIFSDGTKSIKSPVGIPSELGTEMGPCWYPFGILPWSTGFFYVSIPTMNRLAFQRSWGG